MQIQCQNRFAKLDLYGVKLAVAGMQEQEGTRSLEHTQQRLELTEHEELAQRAGESSDGVPGMISVWSVLDC